LETGKKSHCHQTKKKGKGRGKQKGKKAVYHEVPCESFFNFFSPLDLPEDLDEELEEEVAERVEMDFEIGFAIREKLVPLAVLCFTDEINPIPSIFEQDDDDQESDDEDNEDEDMTSESSPFSSTKNSNIPVERPPDCNQQ